MAAEDEATSPYVTAAAVVALTGALMLMLRWLLKVSAKQPRPPLPRSLRSRLQLPRQRRGVEGPQRREGGRYGGLVLTALRLCCACARAAR